MQVLNAFSSAGVDLESMEAVPVDPNSSPPPGKELKKRRSEANGMSSRLCMRKSACISRLGSFS